MEIIIKGIDEIRPYENNPRVNDGAVGAVAESIRVRLPTAHRGRPGRRDHRRSHPLQGGPKAGADRSTRAWGKHGDSYQTAMHKTMQLSDDDLIAALSFEFDLPLPSGRSYGRQADIIAACRRAGLLHSDGQTANYGTCRTP